jgi:hypothetical protein
MRNNIILKNKKIVLVFWLLGVGVSGERLENP